jgi:hypothetical protein
MPPEATARQPLCADIDGFSLHAAVRVEAHVRKRLELLCRYITRPALSDERIQVNAAGQVQLELKTPWRDGTTHLVLSPLEFMLRLAALMPRPRLHLIRYHGVLAPNATLRAQVVPRGRLGCCRAFGSCPAATCQRFQFQGLVDQIMGVLFETLGVCLTTICYVLTSEQDQTESQA